MLDERRRDGTGSTGQAAIGASMHIGLPPGFNADGSLEFSVHPASNTRGQEFAHFGTEYFLSTFDITSILENRISVWALQNTVLLNFPASPATRFRLLKTVIVSEVYGVPPDALQKRGTLPLGSAADPTVFEMLATNEHRMQDVTFADGNLWSSVTTGLTSPGEADVKAGIAWFSVAVDAGIVSLHAEMDRQGYLVLANANLFFPAVGVNSSGGVVIGFSISGPIFFPSTGYVSLGRNGRAGNIHIAGVGVNSEDGFSWYPHVSSTPPCIDLGNGNLLCEARWGDYAAAVVDDDGSIWVANEYIGPRPRTALANWGTFVTRVRTGGTDN